MKVKFAPLTFIKNERKSSLDANLTNLAGHLTNLAQLALRVVPKRPEGQVGCGNLADNLDPQDHNLDRLPLRPPAKRSRRCGDVLYSGVWSQLNTTGSATK